MKVLNDDIEKITKHLANGAVFEVAPTPSEGTYALNLVPLNGPRHRLALSHDKDELRGYMRTLKTKATPRTALRADGTLVRKETPIEDLPHKYTFVANVTRGTVPWLARLFGVKYTRGWRVSVACIRLSDERTKQFIGDPEPLAPTPEDVASATAELCEKAIHFMENERPWVGK